jgi:hypothetical protein
MAPVTMSASAPGGRSGQRIFIAVRPSLIDGLTWWQHDAHVSLQLGAGEHAGLLRVQPARTGFRVRFPNGPSKTAEVPILLISFPTPSDLPRLGRQPPAAVEFDYGDDWLEVTLPAWARPAEETPKPTPIAVAPIMTPPPKPATKPPFRGHGSTGIDALGPAGRRV